MNENTEKENPKRRQCNVLVDGWKKKGPWELFVREMKMENHGGRTSGYLVESRYI